MYPDTCLPILKPTVELSVFNNKVVLNHGEDSFLLEDSVEFLILLCELLTGHSTVAAIIAKLQQAYPEKNQAELLEAIEQLDSMLLLEDNHFNLTQNDYLDEETIARWQRNFDFFGSLASLTTNKYEIHKQLKNSKVCLLGLGGLGSNILLSLAALGVQNVVAADFDKIDKSNLNRQILYKTSDIGSIKSVTADKRIKDFYPDINTSISQQKFESMEQLASFIKNCDIVIGVADKPRMKMPYWMNEACVKNNIPFISGGVSVNRGVFYSVIPGKTGCVKCWRDHANQQNELNETIHNNKHATHTEFETPYSWPAIIPLVSFVSGAMVTEMVKILTNLTAPSFTNKLTQISFKNVETKVIETWVKNENCTVCGG
jgi:molybdopterin/thiamine biosynthesis adenylyltransferase